MKKIAVIYWSGTGNTEMMADYVSQGIKSQGAEAEVIQCSDFNKDQINNYSALALGCPSMGSEQLEESEFEPMFNDIKESLKGKKIGLFGAYGWGDGEWMRNWESDCENSGALLASASVISSDAESDDTKTECINLGSKLAS